RGSGFEFVNKTVGGVVPKQYIGSVEKGVTEALGDGILAHYPIVDMRVTLYDGKEHPVDSSDIAFKLAAAQAMKKGAQDAQPCILEPIMDLQVTVPEANTGDVINDLNGKRARVLGMTPSGMMTTIDAQAPLAEVQRYAADMRSITQGRGYFTMSLSHYEEALERRLSRTEKPAVLIGHSRGGILAKAIATRLGERASHLVILGSPVGGMMRFRWGNASSAPSTPSRRLGEASSRARNLLDPDCDAPDCGCAFFPRLRPPPNWRTKVGAVYSRDDRIVPA